MFQQILSSLKTYGRAFQLLKELKLWKYFAIPILISFLTAIIVVASSLYFAENLGNQIVKIWQFSWGGEFVSTLSHIIGGLLIFLVGLVLYKHIVMAFSAPFMSPVSEKIEAHYLGSVSKEEGMKAFSNSLLRAIKINARNLGKELLFIFPLFFLSLIPVIGIVFSILIFLIQAYYAGFGNMDYTLERHYNYSDSIKFVKKNKGIAIGNGVGFMLLLLIPVIGFILVLPLSVVAASYKTVLALDANDTI
ncbi:EI24 domain-containing protein [Pseudofulvibacter geojedonensis]|uniref:EI24 domain-containing protein n=1 Tax=Pseudofulvibacter geojedonensis TaxID=1123758 RepID=A0ABW3I068_9FLAO